jgi:cyclopropane-fatty-acyl-phospholipid synthase
MSKCQIKDKIQTILLLADIKIDGGHPWDIYVYNEDFYQRVLYYDSLGLGESYMDGWWDCQELDQFFYRILRVDLDKRFKRNWRLFFDFLKVKLFNLESRSRTFCIAKKHYDIGNDLYKNMLCNRMVYTCGYWKNAANLDEAQEAKLELVCKKLNLQHGMNVLDIGCGWGSFAKYAAEKYRVTVVGITISKEQTALGKKFCEGLPVEIKLQDYREVKGKFDRIVSLGMFEHVGYKNYRNYMKIVNSCLNNDGLFLIQTIGRNESEIQNDCWIEKYIFPNSMLPSAKQVAEASEGLLVIEDWHNFGTDYDKTLMSWYQNFTKNWHKMRSNRDEVFYRMWKYYLLSCAGAFRARRNQLWQIVFSKKGGSLQGYISVR